MNLVVRQMLKQSIQRSEMIKTANIKTIDSATSCGTGRQLSQYVKVLIASASEQASGDVDNN